MEKKILGYCGVDCGECQVLIATEKDDNNLRKSYAEMLFSKYSLSLKIGDINCTGCVKGTLEGSFLMDHCQNCDVRKCAGARGVNTCADCSEYICAKLTTKWNEFPAEIRAKENLLK